MDKSGFKATLQAVEEDFRSNNPVEAEYRLNELGKRDDLDSDQLLQAGLLAKHLGHSAFTLYFLNRAREHDKNSNADILAHCGEAHIPLNILGKAEEYLKAALSIQADHHLALAALGRLYLITNRHQDAIETLQRAISVNARDPYVSINLSIALTHVNDYTQALEVLETARAQGTGIPQFHTAMGNILAEQGDLEGAQKAFRQAIKADPNHGMAYINLARVKKFTQEDLKEIRHTKKLLKNNLSKKREEPLHFALGKMLDDIGQYDEAFEHYRQGNNLAKPHLYPKKDRFTLAQRNLAKARYRKPVEALALDSDLPIFIVGMPRSGTTLLTQMLSRHSHIASAGERIEVANIAREHVIPRTGLSSLWRPIDIHEPAAIQQKARHYVDTLALFAEGKRHVIDKLPGNYIHLGFIHALFPRARIIHIQRHPLDTCLSCYFQYFEHHLWTHDLTKIAETYHDYRQMMALWKRNLPEATLTEVNYEDLLDNSESEVKRLLDFLGLDWEDACLDHKRSRTAIATASIWQARQPIYKSSKQRWKHYGKHIQELAKALSPYLQDDKDTLAGLGINLN